MGRFSNVTDLQADNSLETEGIDLDFGKGRVITVARSGGGNRKYRATLTQEYKKNKSMLDRGTMDDEEAGAMLRKVFAKTVVIGWSGWLDEAGEEILYSQQACEELFEDAPEIFRVVQDESEKFSNFARQEVEDSGN